MLAVLFLALFAALAHAHNSKHRREGAHHSRPLTLHPTVHHELDTEDLAHLKPNDGLSLHYHDAHGPSAHSQP
jgi:hypothetical protein